MTERTQRRLAAIVSADVAGYSRLMGVDEIGTLAALNAHRSELIDPLIDKHGGRIVKTMGDGLLLEFPSVVDATTCVIEIQRGMIERNAAVEEGRHIAFRVGVNLGDIIIDGQDIHGDGVNIAARLQEISEVGGVVVSQRVYEDVRDRLEFPFDDAGEQTLKNIVRPVHVWRWSAQERHPVQATVATSEVLTLPDKPSIAVLPFDNMSGDPEQEYFADGIAEDLITALSRISRFFVIARNSSFAFRGLANDMQAIGAKLGVRYLLEGSVRKAGNRVRISVQLIEARSGHHLWADRYDGSFEDIFDLQDRITESVIGAIAPKLRATEIERSDRKRPESLEAYDFVLRALQHSFLFTKENFDRALGFLNQAIALEPNYSEALAYAAFLLAHKPFLGWSSFREDDFEDAKALAQRALAADPDDPIALIAAGTAAVLTDRDYDIGLELADRALTIDLNSAQILGSRGWIRFWCGDSRGSISDFERAIRLSPFDQWNNIQTLGMAFALLTSGDFEEALPWARKAVQGNPHWNACYRVLVGALELSGHHDEACVAAARHQALDPSFLVDRWIETGPFRRTPEQEVFFAALRRAGLPG